MAQRSRCSSRFCPTPPTATSTVLLGVPASASADEITAACRRLARTFHPDHNGSVARHGRDAGRQHGAAGPDRSGAAAPSTTASGAASTPAWVASRFASARPCRSRPCTRCRGRRRRSERYARATLVGVRVTVTELLPARCSRLPGRDPGRRGRVLCRVRDAAAPPQEPDRRPRRRAGSRARGRCPARRSRASARPASRPPSRHRPWSAA